MPYPALPAETLYSDIERNLMENEPPGAFPEDQNSYWGQMRKLFADYIQANSMDLFTAWYANLDPRVVDINDIGEWEERVGVPGDRSALTLAARQAFILSRLSYGGFSRGLVNRIIENFINAVLVVGTGSTSFGAGGISFGAGGATLYSGVTGDPKTMYRVYYDYMNRTYYVRLLNTLGEDLLGLTRELTRITPGGWTLNISEVANPLLYTKAILDQGPVGYWKLDNNGNDASGYADTATLVAAPGSVASLIQAVADGGGGSALSFNGTTQYATIPHAAQLNVADRFSIELWVKPTNFTGNPRLVTKGGTAFEVYIDSTGTVRLQRPSDATLVAHSSVALTAGTIYHIVVTKKYDQARIYINGVDRTVNDTLVAFVNNTNLITVAKLDGSASNFFNGTLDEVAIYNQVLTPAQVLARYNTGSNVA